MPSNLTLFISLGVSITIHVITFFSRRRQKFVAIGSTSYKELKSWSKVQEYMLANPDEYKVYIYEKGEYSYLTSASSLTEEDV